MPPPAGGSGGREDCWSEGGTACLVDAWGDRYLQLSRGNLRQKDWSDVAASVNRRQELLGRPRRTDVQCKNRIDTVKKKYRLEKSKPGPSPWPLFDKLDSLVGAPLPPSSAAATVKNPRLPLLTFTVKPRKPNLNPNHNLRGVSGGSSSRYRSRSQSSSEISRTENGGDADDDSDDEEDDDADDRRLAGILTGGFRRDNREWEGLVECKRGVRGRRRGRELGQLARAIVGFAEIYERVESAKQQQVMELERHRMELVKDLEFQRMKMFMEARLEIDKMKTKRPKYNSGSGKM